MGAEAAFDRWYILKGADSVSTHSYTTQDIVTLHARGALADRVVVYPVIGSRRADTMTVAELVAARPDVTPRPEDPQPYR